LQRVLPAQPAGPSLDTPYRPTLTDEGSRHPVTRALPASWGSTDWGRWGNIADLTPTRGRILMTGAGDRPLLMLDRIGEGRVGMIASTDIWWWTRAVDGAGPRDELLRRTSHWLMQEPDLDEEQLRVAGTGDGLDIEAEGMTRANEAIVTDPGGRDSGVALSPTETGSQAKITGLSPGLYDVRVGDRRRFALVGNMAELNDVRPREAPLSAAAETSGGGTYWLQDGTPDILRVDLGDTASGGDWLGIVRRDGGALIAVETKPLLPPWLGLAALLGALALAWWRERN
ncbi:MAG: hypothetical protein WA979_10490, partial [Pacificimonas sp.]